MFNDKLQPIYDGKVLVNQSAMNDPIVQAVLKEMSLRNFEPMPQHQQVLGTSQTGTHYEQATNVHKRRL